MDLAQRCKGEVIVHINENRSDYITPTQWQKCMRDGDVADDILAEMIARDTVVTLQFYPHTPIGSYTLYHYDLDAVIQQAHELLDDRGGAQ